MSNMKDTELQLSRKNTQFVLDNYGEQIHLKRPQFVERAGGRTPGVTIDVIGRFDVSVSLVSTTAEGTVGRGNSQTADLMGRWDADIQRGDWFVYGDLAFTVQTVIRRDYAVNAEATTNG